MGKVRVTAPDGSTGTIDDSELADAQAQGFRVDGADAVTGASMAAAPEAAQATRVRVRAPDGSTGSVDASELEDAKAQGYTDLAQEQYQTGGQKLATVGEGLARGATLGASDAVQTAGAGLGTGIGNWVADKLIGETPGVEHPIFDVAAQDASYADIQGRREANKALAVGSELVGAVGAAVASGGAGSAGALARMTPAGQLAALSTKMGTQLLAKAGGSALGRIGALAGIGAAEGVVDNVTRAVLDDIAKGDLSTTGDRMADAAWEGVQWGGGVGGGIGALAETARAGAKVVGKIADALPSVEDFANGRAFKAALGRTNLKGVRAAERFGGPEAIGKTLLDEGVVTAGATIEDIAERSGSLRETIGQQLSQTGKQIDELSGGVGVNGNTIADELHAAVIKPLLDSPINQDVGQRLQGQLEPLFEQLRKDQPVSFDQVRKWRTELDQRINWEKVAPDVATEQKRALRATLEDAWLNQAEDVAAKAGKPGMADEIRGLKRRYSHVALANDLAEEAIQSRLSNRFVSASDYGVGAASAGISAIASGGASLGTLAMGAAGSMANKLIRERGNQVVAGTLYRLAKGAVGKERSLAQSVDNTIRSLAMPATTRAVAFGGMPELGTPQMQQMIQQAQELQDPASPATAQLDAMTLQLASESPEFADAIRQKVLQKASFIVDKMGPTTDPGDPLKARPRMVDRVSQARTDRFLRAASDPSAALDRLAHGQGSAEDLAVVRELTPTVHKRYVDGVMKQLVGSKKPLSMAQQQRLHFALGTPVATAQTPAYIAHFSALLAGQKVAGPDETMGELPANRQGGGDVSKLNLDSQHFAGRADSLMGGNDD
jgi:hypothetical protein